MLITFEVPDCTFASPDIRLNDNEIIIGLFLIFIAVLCVYIISFEKLNASSDLNMVEIEE